MVSPQAFLLSQFPWEEGQGGASDSAPEDSVRREEAELGDVCSDLPSGQVLKDVVQERDGVGLRRAKDFLGAGLVLWVQPVPSHRAGLRKAWGLVSCSAVTLLKFLTKTPQTMWPVLSEGEDIDTQRAFLSGGQSWGEV